MQTVLILSQVQFINSLQCYKITYQTGLYVVFQGTDTTPPILNKFYSKQAFEVHLWTILSWKILIKNTLSYSSPHSSLLWDCGGCRQQHLRRPFVNLLFVDSQFCSEGKYILSTGSSLERYFMWSKTYLQHNMLIATKGFTEITLQHNMLIAAVLVDYETQNLNNTKTFFDTKND